jgi:hypothetical protein
MIDAQLACEASTPIERSRRVKSRRKRLILPAAIASRWEDLLCIVGEANAWPYRAGSETPPSELVHWLAYRPSDGSLFEAIAAPAGELSPSTTFHSELTSDQITAGTTAKELVRRFASFVRPTDVVCEWGYHSTTLFRTHGGVLPDARLDLRLIAQRYAQGKVGALETYAGSVTPLAPGRGGRRLAMLAALLRTWHGLIEEYERDLPASPGELFENRH